jgi:hypothetical protein
VNDFSTRWAALCWNLASALPFLAWWRYGGYRAVHLYYAGEVKHKTMIGVFFESQTATCHLDV